MAIKTDTFTVGTNTPLENHISDSGGGWSGEDTTSFDVIETTGEVSYDGVGGEWGLSGGGAAIGTESPSTADYYVEFTGKLGSIDGTSRIGAVLRYNTTTNDGNYFRHIAWAGIVGIYLFSGGTQSELGNADIASDINTYYAFKFQILGNVLNLDQNS